MFQMGHYINSMVHTRTKYSKWMVFILCFFLPHKKQGLIVGNHHNINSLVVNTTQYIAMAVCVHFSDVFDMRSD